MTEDVNLICNQEKAVPADWITGGGSDIGQEFIDYALPLIQGDVKDSFRERSSEICLPQISFLSKTDGSALFLNKKQTPAKARCPGSDDPCSSAAPAGMFIQFSPQLSYSLIRNSLADAFLSGASILILCRREIRMNRTKRKRISPASSTAAKIP